MDKFFSAKLKASGIETSGEFNVALGNRSFGVFAEWNWDGDRLILKNDRYGFYPIYYFKGITEIAVSPSISKLLELAGDLEIDFDAFAVFLRLGWPIGEDTLFKSIRALPPGSTLIWERGEFSITSQGIIKGKTLTISREEAVETYAELFQKAVEKTVPADSGFAVPISGGRDSRHILLALCKAGKSPDACLTIVHPPPRANEDARIAAMLCKELNVKHELVEQSASIYSAEIEKNLLTGFSVYEHGWFLTLANFIKDRWPTVYDGIAGDVLSAGLFLDERRLTLYRDGKFEDLAENILEPEGYIPAIFTADVCHAAGRERAIGHLCGELALHADEPNPVGSFFFWNRTRRCIAVSPYRLLGDYVNVVTPYLDPGVFDFLSSLPAELMLDHEFHSETIAFAYPDLAHVPYEKKDAGRNVDTTAFQQLGREIARYSLSGRKRPLVKRGFVFSRVMRSLIDKRYSPAVADFGQQVIHALQLERL